MEANFIIFLNIFKLLLDIFGLLLDFFLTDFGYFWTNIGQSGLIMANIDDFLLLVGFSLIVQVPSRLRIICRSEVHPHKPRGPFPPPLS